MAQESNNSIFQRVYDAVNNNKRRTPPMDAQGQPPGISTPSQGLFGSLEDFQQQYLDWQVNKISHDLYTRTIYYDTDRVNSYHDYRAMDQSPEVSAALDIIRDECLTRNERGNILEVYSSNDRIKSKLDDLFHNRMNIDYNLSLWIRDLIKYGDYFVHLHVHKDEGIYDFMTLPQEEIHREEGFDGTASSVRFRWETTQDYFESWQVAHFRLIEDTRKLPYGRCLKHDTYIETSTGYKFIKDIEKGDLVFSFNSDTQKKEVTKVLDTICSGEKEIIKIRTKNNEIETSEEHSFMVYEDGGFVYKQVDDLRLGNLLVIDSGENPSGVDIFLNKELKEERNFNGYKNNIDLIPDVVDVDFARLWGFLLGDGWVFNDSVFFARGIDESLNKKYASLLKKFSGKDTINLKNANLEGSLEFSQTVCNSKLLSYILENNGFKGNVYIKRLPSWIFEASLEIREALIEGIIDADGSVNIDEWNCKRYTIELANEILVKDLKTLLQSIGRKTGKICSRDRSSVVFWGKEYKRKKSFYFYFYDSKIKQAAKHELSNRINSGFILSPIISIENSEKAEQVYDIHVEHEHHNFYANGIVVHNSILDPARKLWKQLQLAEDSMLVYRITRAPERRIFYIEVGNLEDADVKQYMQRIQKQVKKQPIVNQNDGNMSYRYDPMNISEDYFIPVRGDKSTKIDTLPGACLALDTKINLLDGRSLELQEIIKERDEGKQLWTYSINPETGVIVPGKITWAGVTRKDAKVMKLTFDNGESVIVTPDHKFPTRFKGIQEAQNLEEGDSMWSFEKRFQKIFKNKPKAKTYEQVWDHQSKSWEYTHRMVHNYMYERNLHKEHVYQKNVENKNVIHHYDFDRYNNSPENLKLMNFHDHVMLHQSMYASYKKERKEGRNKYWDNISEKELESKRVVARINLEKATERIQELLQDEDFKADFEKKRIAGYRKARKTSSSRLKSSIAASKQWADGSLREAIQEKQEINYNDVMLEFVVSRFQDGMSATNILRDINVSNSGFMSEFNNINKGNKQLKKMSSFTHNNLVKMMKSFGYSNWRDFTKKAELFNHKVASIEWLETPQDTGTITVDGNHELHDHHNFALSVGVFTQNSNLGDIQDIEYLENKLFAALKVPKTYLNYAENLPGGPTLSQADLRFARTINRIQEQVLMELRRIGKIHLAFLGHEDEINDFDLKLTNPSTQQELLKLETMKSRLEVFTLFVSQDIYSPASYTWGMKYILGFSEKDIKKMLRQKKVERKLFTEIEFAPQTYKKIGLFKDLDDKFEIPGAAEALQNAENEDLMGDDGGGGGGGFGGGGDSLAGDPSGDLDMGGGDEVGGDAGGAPPVSDSEPISETKRERIWEGHNKRVDSAIDDLLKELEETDEEVFTEESEEEKKDREKNVLFKSNEEFISQTDKMISEIKGNLKESEKNIENYIIPKGVIKERVQGNPLVSTSNDLARKARDIMDEIDQIISETGQNSDMEIIEEDYDEEE